jgi:pullulanase/glycogen debranching enzyme
MIYMGDEYGHTKGGNNNTYCHDNYVIPLHLAGLCASIKSIY